MKVLFIGMSSTGYIRDNWLTPMRKLFDVTYIPYDILMRALGVTKLNRLIVEKSQEEFDYIFFYPDGRGQMFSDDLFETLRGKRTIVFHSDDVPEAWYRHSSRFDYRYEYIVSSSRGGYLKRVSPPKNWQNVCYVPWGYNPDIFYKQEEQKDTDVVFLGSNFYKDGNYCFDGAFRQRIITRIYEESLVKGFSFRVYGAGWDQHPIIKNCYAGFADSSEINGILNRTKIILGLGYTVDENPAPHTKLRHFENSGTGSFQLVNENPELREIFGDSLGYFDGIEDMIDKINYFLLNDIEREEKASEAYRICKTQCSIESRIQELFTNANRYFNHVPVETKQEERALTKEPRIKHVKLSETLSSQDTVDYDYMHFYDDSTQLFDFNQTLLPEIPMTNENYPKAVGFASTVMFCDEDELKPAVIIRRCAGPDVVTVGGTFHKGQIVYGERLSEILTCEVEEELRRPVTNYLIRSDLAEEFFTNLKRGVIKLPEEIFQTQAICGDLIAIGADVVRERYCHLFEQIFEKYDNVAVYGLSGYIFEIWEEWIASHDYKARVCYLDRARVGQKIGGIQCIDPVRLLNGELDVSVVLITAIYAGEEIFRLLKPVKEHIKILKLYDMTIYENNGGVL